MPDDAKRDAAAARSRDGNGAPDEEQGTRGAAPETVSEDVPDADARAKGSDEAAREPEVIEVEGELLEEGPAPDTGRDDGQAAGQDEVTGRDLEAELVNAQGEAERHLDDLRRLKADFENYRKRVLREQTARAQSASQALVTKLLPVLDHFELAMTAMRADDGKGARQGDLDKMRKGVEMVLGELRDVLRGEGLEQIEAEGKPFDPQRHEAVASVDSDDHEPGTVVGVVRAGYELHGRVIRPAMVRVSQ